MKINNKYSLVYKSPFSKRAFAGCPGITLLKNGRLVCTLNVMGSGEFNEEHVVTKASAHGFQNNKGKFVVGKVFASDDKGKTWQHKANFPFFHARPFIADNGVLYIIGHCGDLKIIRSDDNGETWSKVSSLTQGQSWHQTSANVCYKGDNIYLVMEREMYDDIKGWTVSVMAPVTLRADIRDDLLKTESWSFAQEVVFRDIIDKNKLDYFGVPFYKTPDKSPAYLNGNLKRAVSPMGWLETNIVQIYDENHYWYDENAFYLFMRAHTGGTGYCAVAKVTESKDGSMTTSLAKMPSGVKAAFLPIPGGHMRFHILYDTRSKLYWLLSSQATDSMTKANKLPSDRYNLPNNQRNRLQLHFSKNCIDWCFAAMVAIGETNIESRHYASMAIDGDDLYCVSRSGDKEASNAHNVNMITFHKIEDFRSLIY